MKNILCGILFFSIMPVCFSQTNIYDASTIPAALKENAHSVKREEKIDFEVKDVSDARLTVHEVVTVLDPEAERDLSFYQSTDEFLKLDDAEIKVFDAHGKQLNKYKLKEMRSQGIGDGLVIDGKAYFFSVTAASYPITVEYDYTLKFKSTLFYPDYQIQDPEQSVEYSKFTATVPSDLDLKYKAQYTAITPAVTNSTKNKTYSWEVKNLPAIPYEEGAVSYRNSYPAVLLSPNKFSMDGNDGNLSSWKNFGEWYAQLSKGSLNLSDQKKPF